MNYLALSLNLCSGILFYYFAADLAVKVDPKDAMMVFGFLFINILTKMIIEFNKEKK
jgi:hypothetical protein